MIKRLYHEDNIKSRSDQMRGLYDSVFDVLELCKGPFCANPVGRLTNPAAYRFCTRQVPGLVKLLGTRLDQVMNGLLWWAAIAWLQLVDTRSEYKACVTRSSNHSRKIRNLEFYVTSHNLYLSLQDTSL